MSCALKEVKHWRHMKETAIVPPLVMPKGDDSKNWMKKIYTCEEKICEFQDNTCKVIAKIREMYTEIVQ